MTDYKRLYHIMVNASEKAIEALEKGNGELARKILICAEQEAEEAYLADGEA